MTPGTDHWELLELELFRTELKELEENESPQLVVPIPRRFGGDQEEGQEAVLETEEEGFTIAKTKDEAEKQRKVLEDVKDVSIMSSVPNFSSEDFELDQKKMELENNRKNELMIKQTEELKNKTKRQAQAKKEFNEWLQ